MADDIRYAIGKPFTTTAGLEGDFVRMTNATAATFTAAGYDAQSVRNEHLERAWRSNSGLARTLTVTIASSQNPDAILVEGCNVDTLTVQGTPFTLDQNPRTGRYGRLIVPAATASAWTFAADSADNVDGNDWVQIGRICFVASGTWEGGAPNNVMQNAAGDSRPWWQPLGWTPNSLGSARQLASGITETTSTSGIFLEFELTGAFKLLDATEISHPMAYTRMLNDQRVLQWEDRANDTNNRHAYLCRNPGSPSVEEEFPDLNVDVSLIEVI